MSSELMDVQAVADGLGISRALVYRYISQDRIHATKLGAQWVITRAEFERFAAIPRPTGKPPGKPPKGEGE